MKDFKNDLENNFKVETWEMLQPFFIYLENKNIDSTEGLKQWIYEGSLLESVISEDLAWRYIKMTIDTTDEKLSKDYQYFVTEIQPKIAPFSDKLNRKFIDSKYTKELSKKFNIHKRLIENQIELYREKNVKLHSEDAQLSQEYGNISGTQSIQYKGEDITLQQAAKHLKSTDREVRKDIYNKIQNRRFSDKDTINQLLDKLIKVRHQIAQNADFENYTQYKFQDMGRFDYTLKDTQNFHQSIQQIITPKINLIHKKRKEKLGVDTLKPYDLSVDESNNKALKPFEKGEELIQKTIEIFNQLDPFFGECLQTMREMKHLDLESKKGKAPGGYNYPLYKTGIPFIFMNAVGSHRDLITMVHEGGHAIHSFLTKDYPLITDKSLTSEIAELASMSMELLSMDYWHVFYENKDDLIRAKKEHLEDIMMTLPWIATIDKYQQYLYNNPEHNSDQRIKNWIKIYDDFSSDIIDWSEYENFKEIAWQKQLHIFEVPFYYIEYGFAQLGAIAIWKNYKENPEKSIEQYKAALGLGYSKTIPEVYETAGIKFDFSANYIEELINFVWEEYQKLSS